MNPGERTILIRERSVIQKIIHNEVWLESERRGCHVPANDPVVRENVCAIVLRVGAEMRETVTQTLRVVVRPEV